MYRNIIETVLGAIVLVFAGFFLILAYSTVDLGRNQGYQVTAEFEDLSGIKIGAPVRMSGVDIGRVESVSLDPQTFLAFATLTIDGAIRLPEDTIAVISSQGLLGGNIITLEPGGAEDLIPQQNGHIDFTQVSPSFTQLLGQVIYRLQSFGEDSQESAP